MGMVYRRKMKGKDGAIRELPTWWVKYYVNGRPVRESAGTDKEQEATRFLKAREGRAAMGQPVLRRADRIRSVFEQYNIVSEGDVREVS